MAFFFVWLYATSDVDSNHERRRRLQRLQTINILRSQQRATIDVLIEAM